MYPEILCSMATLIIVIVLFAGWAGMLDKLQAVELRLHEIEKRYNALIEALDKKGIKIVFIEPEVKNEELDGIIAAVVVQPPIIN